MIDPFIRFGRFLSKDIRPNKMLTEFQEKKLKYFFDILDGNRNGFLQIDDFQEMAESLAVNLGHDFESEDYLYIVEKCVGFFHRLLRDISNSKNQTITPEGWISFFDEKIIAPFDEELLDDYVDLIIGFLFDLFDKNNDGYISIEEYSDLFMTYGIDIKYSAKSFVNLDVNGDQRLSKNELNHAAETFLTSDDPLQKGNWIFGNWDTIHSA